MAANIALIVDGNDNKAYVTYVLNWSHSVSDKLSIFSEVFGEIKNGRLSFNGDAGLAYLVNNDLQLDVFYGHQIGHPKKSGFASMGLSHRIHLKKNAPHYDQ